MVWECCIKEDDVVRKPTRLNIDVAQDDLAEIAERVGVQSVESLKAHVEISRPDGGLLIEVVGSFSADLTQECVVSCEAIKTHVEDEFEAFFANKEQAVIFAQRRKEQDLKSGALEVEISSERDEPEPVVGGVIDLADVVIQFLSLAIDPYPKKEGAEFEGDSDEDSVQEPAESRKNPFEALRQLKDL